MRFDFSVDCAFSSPWTGWHVYLLEQGVYCYTLDLILARVIGLLIQPIEKSMAVEPRTFRAEGHKATTLSYGNTNEPNGYSTPKAIQKNVHFIEPQDWTMSFVLAMG
uniref:Uncharacterized protein LOC104249667 n=1 Tax=Nicotiana sylvestris TaxID=4096 RepID=A0A1U7YK32_NICSY|nr:PREDICTED: uncharacterized protein LOC104249667 [Nicotiana sylvestris]